MYDTITIRGSAKDFVPSSVINPYSALSVPPYFRAMSFIADNMGSFPRSVHKDGSKDENNHPVERFLKRRPNQFQTAFNHWRTWYFHAANTGNGYSRIKRATDGAIRGLYNLNPEDVTPFRFTPDDGPAEDGQQWYYFAPTKSVFASSDILHLPGLGYDGMVGYDPVSLMSDTFQRAKTLTRYQTKFLQKGSFIRGSIEMPPGLTDEQQQQIVDTAKKYRGDNLGADGDVLVLSGGAKLENKTISPVQSQLIEQAQFTTKEIAQITGVDPQFLYEYSEAKYNGDPEQRGQDIVRFFLRSSWLENAEDELTAKLLTEYEQEQGYSIKINPDALLRGSTEAQSKVLAQDVGAGIRTKNEAREKLDLPRDENPESDQLLTPHAVASAPVAASADQTNATAEPVDTFAVLKPILADAIERIETRTRKVFAETKKDGQERIAWGNVFAEQQAGYVRSHLTPIAEAAATLAGVSIDVGRVANQYSDLIKRMAAGSEAGSLSAIVEGVINDK